MDWSEKISCIKCDKGGILLVCSENGCPIAVHEGCLGCPAKFDDSGRFYCPYCLYKQAVAELRKAREYAFARKNALNVFMDEKVMGSEKPTRENKTHPEDGNNQSKSSEANVGIAGDDGKSKSNTNGITDQPVRLDGEEHIKDCAGSESDDPSLEILGEKNDRTEEDKNVQEEEHETSAQEHIQEEELIALEQDQIQEEDHEHLAEEQIQEEERETSVEEEKTREENRETSSASTDDDAPLIGHATAKTGSKRSKQVDKRKTSVEEEKTQEENRETSSASTDDDAPLVGHARAKRGSKRSKQVDKRETSVEEEKALEENRETSSASTDDDAPLVGHARAKRGSKRSKQVDKDSDADQVPSKRVKKYGKKKQTSTNVTPTRRSSRKSSAPKRTEKVSNKEVGSPTRLRKPEPSVKLASDAFGSAKRKRLMWTEREEEALRAGVDRYSNESKNLSWRKILDMGKDHFDSTRTPADLKDKWRNMTGK